MGNLLPNAGFLDDEANWYNSTSLDESDKGAPGRTVLGGTTITSEGVFVTPGALYDIHCLWSGVGAAPVVLWNAGAIVTPIPVRRAASMAPFAGVRLGFNYSYLRMQAPPGATVGGLQLTGTGFLTKPYLGRSPTEGDHVPMWDPGPSSNMDLDLSAWPAELPPILDEGFGVMPTPIRARNSGFTNHPTMSRVANAPWYEVKGVMRLTAPQVAILEAFHEQVDQPFFFTRPDNDALCMAQFTDDGAPALVRTAADGFYYSFGLIVRVA